MWNVIQSNGSSEEVEPGRFVRKCVKTKQILRDCAGREPYCILESKTEHTVEEVSEEEMADEFKSLNGRWVRSSTSRCNGSRSEEARRIIWR